MINFVQPGGDVVTIEQKGKGRLIYLPEIMERTGMPEGTIRSKRHGGTLPFVWKLGRRLVAWEAELDAWMADQQDQTAKDADPNVTKLLVTVTWDPSPTHGPYYLPEERVDMLRRWIDGALNDRDDGPSAEISLLP